MTNLRTPLFCKGRNLSGNVGQGQMQLLYAHSGKSYHHQAQGKEYVLSCRRGCIFFVSSIQSVFLLSVLLRNIRTKSLQQSSKCGSSPSTELWSWKTVRVCLDPMEMSSHFGVIDNRSKLWNTIGENKLLMETFLPCQLYLQ